jgi:phage-related protein (TIGR01555 family)
MNALTGLGTMARDKVQSYIFSPRGRIDDSQLEALYEEDGIAAKVADAPPEHMLRRGWDVVVKDNPAMGEAIKKYLEALGFTQKLTDAMVWERVFGGAALVMGWDDGRPVNEPLDEDNLRGLLFINVVERRDVLPYFWYADPSKPKFGEVATYMVNYFVGGTPQPGEAQYQGRQLQVHETRMVVFRGGRITLRGKARNNGWGTSVLGKVYNELRSYTSVWQAVENMVQDASQGVFKIKGLSKILSSGNRQTLIDRMALVNMGRSVAQAIVIDADQEEFERKDTSMSGIPELIDRNMVRLAGVAKVPVTVLAGISPAGLNATGESDIRNWYDTLESDRTQTLTPKMEEVVRLTVLCKKGPTRGVVPDNLKVTFPSLWQPTDQEKAQNSATQTQSDVALIQAGVTIPEEVRSRRAEELQVDATSSQLAIAEYNRQLVTGEGELGGPSKLEPLPTPDQPPAAQEGPSKAPGEPS